MEKATLDLSWPSILKMFSALFIFYILYLLRNVLVWMLFAFILSFLFNPAIDFLEKKKISRVLATIFVYLAGIFLFALLIYFISPLFISEVQYFLKFFPQYFSKFSPPLRALGLEAFADFDAFSRAIESWLLKSSSGILVALFSLFGGIVSTIGIFSIAMFLSMEEKGLERFLVLLFPKKYENYVIEIWKRSEKKVSLWFWLRVLASLFVGFFTFLVALIFQIRYSLSIGLLTALFDIIPVLGPLFAGFLIFLFALFTSLPRAILLLVAFILIQQLEGNLLTPFLTKKLIGLSPTIVLIALIVGGELWGIWGAILAIPLAGVLYEVFLWYLEKRREEVL